MASFTEANYNTPFNLNPLSYASVVIGFISFAFTFLTLLRVTWGNIIGLWEAPEEIRYTFANLKSALHEERAHCRVAWRIIATQLRYEERVEREDHRNARDKRKYRSRSRKGHRRRKSGGKPPYSPTLAEAGIGGAGQADAGYSDDSDDEKGQDKHVVRSLDSAANWKVLYGSVRRLCKQFSDLERPFLKAAVLERQQRADQVRRQAAAQEKHQQQHSFSDIDTDEDFGLAYDEAEVSNIRGRNGHFQTDDYLRDYVSFDISHRVMWLRIRSDVNDISVKLQQVQIRRSSAEITQVLRSVATVEAGLRDLKLIQDQHGRGGGGGGGNRRRSRGADRRDDGERWERVHVRRSIVQGD